MSVFIFEFVRTERSGRRRQIDSAPHRLADGGRGQDAGGRDAQAHDIPGDGRRRRRDQERQGQINGRGCRRTADALTAIEDERGETRNHGRATASPGRGSVRLRRLARRAERIRDRRAGARGRRLRRPDRDGAHPRRRGLGILQRRGARAANRADRRPLPAFRLRHAGLLQGRRGQAGTRARGRQGRPSAISRRCGEAARRLDRPRPDRDADAAAALRSGPPASPKARRRRLARP